MAIPIAITLSYAEEIGVPVAIAYAERALFMALQKNQAAQWTKRFVEALPIGLATDRLDSVWRQLALFVLADSKYGLLNGCGLSLSLTDDERSAIEKIIQLYDSSTTDAATAKAAARAARQLWWKGPHTNSLLKGKDAFSAVGAQAVYAASYFGLAIIDQRYAAQALSGSAWAFRYQKYAEAMAKIGEPIMPKPDENGLVNCGEAFFALAPWYRKVDDCESEGELVRLTMYEHYADEFIRLLRQAGRENATGAVAYLRRLKTPSAARPDLQNQG